MARVELVQVDKKMSQIATLYRLIMLQLLMCAFSKVALNDKKTKIFISGIDLAH